MDDYKIKLTSMATVRFQGKTKVMFLPVTTSTAFTKNTIVAWASNLIASATSSSAVVAIAGVIEKTIASTDTDYATSRLVPVVVPVEKYVVWKQDFSTTTLTSSNLGIEYDLADSGNVNTGGTSIKFAIPLTVISTTQGLVLLKFGNSY